MNLYQENILDHYKNPRNFGVIKNADKIVNGANLSCGDEIRFYMNIDDSDKILKLRWNGQACAICFASASILSEQIIGKKYKNIKKITNDRIVNNLSISLSPTRLKCALLPLETLQKS